MTARAGRLAGIARHDGPRAPIEVIERAKVTLDGGIDGDARGAAKGKPYRRQVSLIEADSFAAARDQCGGHVDWHATRRNLLVEGLRLPREAGTRLRIGDACTLEVTDECDPCARMDEVHGGLRNALRPDWRGGFLAKVITAGPIATGDEIRIET